MIFFFHKKSQIFCCLSFFLCSFLVAGTVLAGGMDVEPKPTIISLDKAWENVLKNAEKNPLISAQLKEKPFRSSLWFTSAKNFYRIQFYEEALKKARDTKEHFDQAVKKAQSSYDEDDENVTQFIITKLKLGLAEIKNRVAEFSSELEQSKVELGVLMGKNLFHPGLKIEDPLKAVQFNYKSWEGFLKKNPGFFSHKNSLKQDENHNLFGNRNLELKVRSHQAFIRVLEASKKMKSARKVNKSVRALMAMESSNYDLGLGDPVDLFESFLVHARYISVSLESVYNFNVAVAEWRQVVGQTP
jgi:hypothetical protein